MFLPALVLALQLHIPHAAAPTIDGSIGADEWKAAKTVALTNGGEAMLLHDGKYLYVAIAAPRNGIGSLCTTDGDDVRILHASAALGTAVFLNGQRTRDFTWTNRDTTDAAARAKFLDAEHWFANATPQGSREREYQIALDGRKEIPFTIAFMSFAPNEEQRIHVWPPELKDACASIDLASGVTDGPHTFEPATWGTIVLGVR
jgi:hypothetical protein